MPLKITKLRAVIRLLAVAAAFAVSLMLFRQALHFSFTSAWFVFIAMLCFLGLIAIARPLLLLRLPRWLRDVRPWERRGNCYRVPGVRDFGNMLRRTPLRLLNADVYLSREQADPAEVSAQLEAAEAAHWLASVLVVPYMVYAALQSWWIVLFSFAVVQVAGNAYPVFHLRWVRSRLERVSAARVLSLPSPS